MNSTKFLYNQAAYAGLAQGETDLASNLDALRVSTGADMPQKQAAEFAARYPDIVTQFNDTETSLSATVYKRYLFKAGRSTSGVAMNHKSKT